MTHEERQAQLLDDYLAALQKDKNAAIPDGLEPEMAEFAQMLYVGQSSNVEASDAKSRVWQSMQHSANNTHTHLDEHSYQEMEPHMKQLKEKQKRSGKGSGWLPLSAAAIVTIIVGLGLFLVMLRGDGSPQLSAIEQQQTVDVMMMTVTAMAEGADEATANAAKTQQPTLVPTSTPSQSLHPFAATSTQLVLDATQQAGFPPTVPPPNGQFTATPIPFPESAVNDAVLVCDFEDDLRLRISSAQLRSNELLVIYGAARDARARSLSIEIFGGFLTDDAYVPIAQLDNPPTTETEVARINGGDYGAGSYLVQLRLSDASGETLSSCALPVTVIEA